MELDPATLERLGAAASGSATAVWVARATGWTILITFALGLLATWALAPGITRYYGLGEYEVGVTYTVAFFALLFLQKAAGAVNSISAEGIGQTLTKRIRRFFGDTDAA